MERTVTPKVVIPIITVKTPAKKTKEDKTPPKKKEGAVVKKERLVISIFEKHVSLFSAVEPMYSIFRLFAILSNILAKSFNELRNHNLASSQNVKR